jgi:site-specific recombinase XerD
LSLAAFAVPESHMNLQHAINEFINNRSIKLSSNTIRNYRQCLLQFGAWTGESRAIESISDADVDAYQMSLRSKYHNNSQLLHASVLHSFFKFCAGRRYGSINYHNIQGPRKIEQLPNVITSAQFERISSCFDEMEYNQLTRKVIFSLLWDTGMRINELISLDIESIDNQKQCAYIRTEKTNRLRIVVWSHDTHRLLVKYLGVRLALNQEPELFQTPPNTMCRMRTRLSARTVQRWCCDLGRELGFKINPHAFRHGKMHQIINHGGDRHHVQGIAGHVSIRSSEVYVRLNEQEQLRLHRKFLPHPTYSEAINIPSKRVEK